MYDSLRNWLSNWLAQYFCEAFAERDAKIAKLEERVQCLCDKLGVGC